MISKKIYQAHILARNESSLSTEFLYKIWIYIY